MKTNILIIVGHENRIFEIMNDTFGIDLLANNINCINWCDIFEINMNNKTINYFKNIATSYTDSNNFIYNTESRIDFANPKKFIYNNAIKLDIIIYLIRHSYSYNNTNKLNVLVDGNITDGNEYILNYYPFLFNKKAKILHNGISLATNSAINLNNYLKKQYNLSNCIINFACSYYIRTQETLYYFQKTIMENDILERYDIFPYIDEYIFHKLNNNKLYYRISNIMYDIYKNDNKENVLFKNNSNYEFFNMTYKLHNMNHNFLDNIFLYMKYKNCI
jgi:hypothetical protein